MAVPSFEEVVEGLVETSGSQIFEDPSIWNLEATVQSVLISKPDPGLALLHLATDRLSEVRTIFIQTIRHLNVERFIKGKE